MIAFYRRRAAASVGSDYINIFRDDDDDDCGESAKRGVMDGAKRPVAVALPPARPPFVAHLSSHTANYPFSVYLPP